MMELSKGGKEPMTLPGGEARTFLEDGDTVIFRGATFHLDIKRAPVSAVEVWRDGQKLAQARIDSFAAGDVLHLNVLVPQ